MQPSSILRTRRLSQVPTCGKSLKIKIPEENVTKPVNDFAGSPNNTILVLLLQQLVQDRHQPFLKLDIVVVRHQQVSNPDNDDYSCLSNLALIKPTC